MTSSSKLLREMVKIAVDWGADEYASDGERTLESDILEALKCVTNTHCNIQQT